MTSLAGLRVLEVATGVAAPWATKLLADLGADVIKVEPPDGDPARRAGPFPEGHDGDPERSGLHLGLNTSKRSVVLDLDEVAGQVQLAALVDEADIVMHDLGLEAAAAVGLDAAALLAERPELVVCAVTPFGQTGPRAHWAAEEMTVVHGGGWGWLIPGDGSDPDAPPLTVPGHPAHFQAGTAAALAALAAADKAERCGIGDSIDLSIQAHVASMLEAAFIAWSYRGDLPGRNDGRILTPWRILPCKDGLIFLVTVEHDQWLRLIDLMGRPDWALLEVFADQPTRAENQDVLNIYLAEWTSQYEVEELWHMGQAERICFAPVFTMAQLADQTHLRERGFFHDVEHPSAGSVTHLGAPFSATPDRWALRRPAPLLGEHTGEGWEERPARTVPNRGLRTASRPLEGVRVVDFSWVWAGPYATLHLGYLGADVLKIESSVRPPLGRRLPIHPPELPESLNTCGYFNQWDQGKRSVELDLTDPAAVATVLELVATADVVVDNFATGVMDRLGLGDDALRAVNPDVIIASVTGYGHTGPLQHYMGYGPTTCPLSGLTALTGHVDGPPVEAGISFGDPAAGLTTAFAIMAALHARARGDEPSRIDTTLWEATATNALEAWMAHALGLEQPGRVGNRSRHHCPHGVFRAAGDDEWVSIVCTDDEQWAALVGALADGAAAAGYATAAERLADVDGVEALVTAWTSGRDKHEIAKTLQGFGIASYPSLDAQELEADEQLMSRGFWARFDHPEVGRRTHSGVPWISRNAESTVSHRAPLMGEHTADVLAELGND